MSKHDWKNQTGDFPAPDTLFSESPRAWESGWSLLPESSWIMLDPLAKPRWNLGEWLIMLDLHGAVAEVAIHLQNSWFGSSLPQFSSRFASRKALVGCGIQGGAAVDRKEVYTTRVVRCVGVRMPKYIQPKHQDPPERQDTLSRRPRDTIFPSGGSHRKHLEAEAIAISEKRKRCSDRIFRFCTGPCHPTRSISDVEEAGEARAEEIFPADVWNLWPPPDFLRPKRN